MSSRKTLSPLDPMSYLHSLDLILKERRLCWYRHVVQSNGTVKTAFDIQVDGKHGPGRTKVTWNQLTERDCREWKLLAIDPHDRHTWRSGVRSAMGAASQLPGQLMRMLPLYLYVYKKSVDDDDDDDDDDDEDDDVSKPRKEKLFMKGK